jgi:peptide/nickel transport system permease protein
MSIALNERKAQKPAKRMPILAAAATLILVLYAAVALLAPWLAPYGERQVVGEFYLPWSPQFLLGTDNLGRDMLSRVIYGARNTIGIAVATTVLSFLIGAVFGFFAALSRGWIDQLVSRSVDILIAIPKLIFALLILSVIGTSMLNLLLTIALLDAPHVFRVARAAALNLIDLEFIEAARVRGEGRMWIIGREILPNALSALLAELGMRFAFVFLFISALGFLGLGIQPPSADWGTMVRENATLITFGSVVPVIPAAAIAMLALAVNFVIDWVLDLTNGSKE